MRKKYKMTGCAKFFIFLIIFVPLVYFGVSYFQGEDPVKNIQDFLNIESSKINNSADDTKQWSDVEEALKAKDREIRDLKSKIDQLEKQIQQNELEIKNLEQRLN